MSNVDPFRHSGASPVAGAAPLRRRTLFQAGAAFFVAIALVTPSLAPASARDDDR